MAVRFGVIGIKGMGGGHIDAIGKVEGAELAALCDIAPDARGKAEALGVAYFDDYRTLVESDVVDAVSICTPHGLHHPMAMAALRNGKHVFVEKPIAITAGQADEMIEAARANGRKLGVAHQYRASGENRAAKRAIDEGRVGAILRVLWTRNGLRTQKYYDQDPWRGTWRMEGGGVLINQSVHDMDLLCWLVGEPVEVSALVANLAHRTEVEDIACAAVRFANGALASIQCDLVSLPGMASREIAGDRGTLVLEGKPRLGTPQAGVLGYIRGDAEAWGMKNEVTWEELEEEPGEGGHAFMVRDFVAAIEEDRAPFVDGEQGRRALELTNAIILSGLTGEAVKLPLDRERYDGLMADLAERRRSMPRPLGSSSSGNSSDVGELGGRTEVNRRGSPLL